MDNLIGVLCLTTLLVGTIAWLLFVASLWVRPAARQRRLLKAEARREYRDARGSVHLQMLRDARERLNEERQSLEGELAQLDRTEKHRRDERDARLQAALARHLIDTRLTEVPGIGPALQQRVLTDIYRDRLEDLRYAYRVPGVGESRQEAINRWIAAYQGQLPALLKAPFPQRDELVAEYQGVLTEIATQRKSLLSRRESLERKQARVEQGIKQLSDVRVDEFVAAVLDPERDAEPVDRYLRGVFAEWEPMPEWFKEVVSDQKAP